MKPRALLIGCGNARDRKLLFDGKTESFGDVELTTLDMDPKCGADVVMTLDGLGQRSLRHPFRKRLPFPDDTFDEMAAYNCLEHWGLQGDWRAYFDEFAEYHRVLKPGGKFGITVPIGKDAIADPGHTRFFHFNHFGFLCQDFYRRNLELGTSCTDYRWYWKLNFNVLYLDTAGNHHIGALLEKA